MSDFFNEALKGGLDSLTADQLEELIIMAQAKRSESKNDKEVYDSNSCPHCGSIAIKKHGTSAKGTPRKICKDCGKTFCYGVEASASSSKLSETQLTSLYIGMIQNLPIGQLAEKMNVSRSTAAKHKLKVMDIIYQDTMEHLCAIDADGNPVFKFDSEVQCDEWFCTVSFKGKRDPEFFIFQLRRFPRHNYTKAEQIEYLRKHGLYDRVMKVPGFFEQLRFNTKNYKRGISNQQVCIVVAVDDDRKLIAKPVSVGRLDSVDARNLLSKHLGKGAILVTDSHASYPVVAQDADVRHVQIESGKHSNGRFNLGDINGVHSEIEKFMPETAERIPATKYLNQYMAFFTWLWLHKGLSLDEKVTLLRRTVNNEITDYNETYDSLRNRPLDINTKGEFPQVV